MSANRKGRSRPLVALGAAVSLAGLSFYLYQQFSSSTSPSDDTNQGESSKAGAKRRYTPTLSLSLPPTFIRTKANMALLEGLLLTLSQYYIITLIAPPPPANPSPSPSQSPTSVTNDPKSSSSAASPPSVGSGVESVAALSHSLSHVVNFDSRRVLEYSKEEGRLALARALACDAHCEVMLEVTTASGVNMEPSSNGHIDEQDDGDVTPRANSPAPQSSEMNKDEKVSLLETYHAEMARIRKSSSVLIFLLLPMHTLPEVVATSQSTVSELDLETVIQPFLLPGQKELSSRVPGVKIVDERKSESDRGKAWTQGARRVGALSKGWQ